MRQFISHVNIFSTARYALLLVLMLLLPTSGAKAQEMGDDPDLDVYEIVMEHMTDAYEWHIITIGETELTIPLPIIIYSKDKGWNMFLSNKLNTESGEYEGFKIAPNGSPHERKIVENINGEWVRPTLDLSMTKMVMSLLFNSILFVAIILGVARWYHKKDVTSKAPKGFVGMMEMFITSIHDEVVKESVGPNYRKYSGLLLTLFFFIFFNNLMSLIPIFPAGVGITGNIAVTLVLALFTSVAINFGASKHYWKDIFWPDVPIFLKVPIPIIPIIEAMGLIIKPFALMVRLFANMMAGHMAIIIFVSLIFISAKMGAAVQSGLTVVSVLFTLFMNVLELLVAFIQAYVFTLLSAVFIGLAQDGKKVKEDSKK